ncbi:MAG: hypothetical protein NTY22_09840, partial [Proteobacteria bacterium]|nr:hypothetical protein [Pseudomonadota bacterium]
LGKITEKVLENGTEKIKEKEKGVCVPRSDFYIAGYIQVPDEYSQYMRKDGVYMGTKNSYERDADINRINALNEKMQKANLETVQPKATKNVNVFSSESISPEHKKIIDNFNYLLEQKDSFLIKSLGLSDTTDLKSIKITSRVDSFDCGFFRSKDKKYTKAIIDSISNAQRDTNAKYCSIAVVYATVGEGEEKTNHLFIYNDQTIQRLRT